MTPVTYTKDGITCQRWTEDRPHVNVDYREDQMFPDGSVKAAENYCRFCLFVLLCFFVGFVFNIVNYTKAATFPIQICFVKTFPFLRLIV